MTERVKDADKGGCKCLKTSDTRPSFERACIFTGPSIQGSRDREGWGEGEPPRVCNTVKSDQKPPGPGVHRLAIGLSPNVLQSKHSGDPFYSGPGKLEALLDPNLARVLCFCSSLPERKRS